MRARNPPGPRQPSRRSWTPPWTTCRAPTPSSSAPPPITAFPAAEIIKLLDESVKLHGKLEGKVGAAFSSSANIGGGNETVIMAIIEAMLVHGMVVQGAPKGDHYGPVSIGAPDERVMKQCRALGERVANLTKKLAG